MRTLLFSRALGAVGLAGWVILGTSSVFAQDGPPPGAFDPAQMRQRMMERMREQFEVKDDAEWKLISERITKVMDLRRSGGGFGGPGPGLGGPPFGAVGGGSQGPGPGGPAGMGPGGPPGGFRRPMTPEMEALQKAVDAKAPAAELKKLVAAVKEARVKRQAELETAQQELRQTLTLQQEAVATSLGLL
jgi:hypothetical protein